MFFYSDYGLWSKPFANLVWLELHIIFTICFRWSKPFANLICLEQTNSFFGFKRRSKPYKAHGHLQVN